jgi:choice-of-anchor A domain-containing protein
MNKLAALLAPLVLGLSLNTTKAAVSYASLGLAGNSNAFIFGNANTDGGHADGSIIVGGDWSGSRYELRQKSDSPNIGAGATGSPIPGNASLYIGGNDNIKGDKGSNVLRTMSGDVYIAGKYSAENVDAQNKGTVSNKSFDLAPTVENLKKLSTDLAKFDSVALTLDPKNTNNVKVNLSLNTANADKNLKVYTVDASILGGGRTLDFSGATGNETIVINVVGKTVDWGWSVNTNDLTGNDDIIWNFADTTTLNIQDRQFNGSILAPNATVNQSQNINGTLIAQTWNNKNSAELHSYTFSGKIPLGVSAPEPAGVMTMAGFLGLVLCSRRRQAVRL